MTRLVTFKRIFKLFFLATAGVILAYLYRNQNSVNVDIPPGSGLEVISGHADDFLSPDGKLSTQAIDYLKPYFRNKGKRPKACFYALTRNSEMEQLMITIRQVQRRFNDKYKYDWVLLNDVPFTDEFKREIQSAAPGVKIKFGVIPHEMWSLPDFINERKARNTRRRMKRIIYGGSESYRYMCHFQSGYFWRHPLVMEYDWYWKVEPGVQFLCDVKYDVFQWMQDNEVAYGFGISIREYRETIPTLWITVKDFFRENPDYLGKDNLMDFFSFDNGTTYNLCHFWGNFEIANFHLWRSPPYRAFFDYLDHAGGFFYERWGDAPVRSIGAGLLLPKKYIHYFDDIGYRHNPAENCPLDYDVWKENNCECQRDLGFTFKGFSCGRVFYNAKGEGKPAYWKNFTDKVNLDVFPEPEEIGTHSK